MAKNIGLSLLIVCVVGIYCAEESEKETFTDTTILTPSTTKATTSEVTTSLSTLETTISTTELPTTMTADTTTTSSAMPNTTTTDKPTTYKPTSPVTVAPTPLPKPEVGKWEITDLETNVTCIRATMAVQFKIETEDKDKPLLHNLSPNATSKTSSCSPAFPENNTQVLSLKDGNFVFTFVFAKDDKMTFVRNISLQWAEGEARELSGKFFPAHNGNSYLCKSQDAVQMENATLEMSDLRVQAFQDKGSSGFSTAEDCTADDKMDNIVPISVACALGAMVIIILIGYLVGRRRSHQRGYQSV